VNAVYLDKACSPVIAIRNVELHRIILDPPAGLRPLYWRAFGSDGTPVQGTWPVAAVACGLSKALPYRLIAISSRLIATVHGGRSQRSIARWAKTANAALPPAIAKEADILERFQPDWT